MNSLLIFNNKISFYGDVKIDNKAKIDLQLFIQKSTNKNICY